MRSLVLSALATLLAASTVSAQTRTIAERLGHPRDAKLVILHADDLGVAHSEDSASFAALNVGAVNSASVMMPTPWVTEVAAYAKSHPDADIGLHLTLTSEWKTYRWGGVAPRDQVPSLYDADGTLPSLTSTVVRRAKPAEVEKELRAQIERARALGIRPTHLDSHMAALYTPELFGTLAKVARSYRLPFNFHGTLTPATRAVLTPNDIVPDTVVMATEPKDRDEWLQYYLDAIRHLRPGLTLFIVHLGFDDAELSAITTGYDAFDAKWRQRDYDVVTSPEFRQALKDNGVVLVTWREIGKAMYPTP
jgi:predicted glycoside hydrolase/deacetylase ChbG (UPF0249 family)